MNTQKEREAFERFYKSNFSEIGLSHAVQLRCVSGRYVLDKARWLWGSWQAAKAQAIPEGFVLVPKKEITDWYLDESEGMWLEELDHWACDLECGEVATVERQKVWRVADQFVAKVYIDEDNIEWQLFDDEATAKKAAEYCKDMVEAAENKES